MIESKKVRMLSPVEKRLCQVGMAAGVAIGVLGIGIGYQSDEDSRAVERTPIVRSYDRLEKDLFTTAGLLIDKAKSIPREEITVQPVEEHPNPQKAVLKLEEVIEEAREIYPKGIESLVRSQKSLQKGKTGDNFDNEFDSISTTALKVAMKKGKYVDDKSDMPRKTLEALMALGLGFGSAAIIGDDILKEDRQKKAKELERKQLENQRLAQFADHPDLVKFFTNKEQEFLDEVSVIDPTITQVLNRISIDFKPKRLSKLSIGHELSLEYSPWSSWSLDENSKARLGKSHRIMLITYYGSHFRIAYNEQYPSLDVQTHPELVKEVIVDIFGKEVVTNPFNWYPIFLQKLLNR